MLINQVHDCYSPWIEAQNRIWESVLQLGQRRFYNKGDVISGAGMLTDFLYYLHRGKAKYFTISPDGNEKILWYLDSGNVIGVAPFLERKPIKSIYNIVAAVERCEIYAFSRECFNTEIMVKYPELVANLIQSMAHKTLVAVTRACDSGALVYRVSKVLLYLVQREKERNTGDEVLTLKGISQQELAFILGVHRVTLNSAITQLKQEGIILHISKRSLVISRLERLVELAQE